MAKLNFPHHYSSLQCHMILVQRAFQYADLMLKKDFSGFSDERNVKRTAFIWNGFFFLHYKCLDCHFWI